MSEIKRWWVTRRDQKEKRRPVLHLFVHRLARCCVSAFVVTYLGTGKSELLHALRDGPDTDPPLSCPDNPDTTALASILAALSLGHPQRCPLARLGYNSTTLGQTWVARRKRPKWQAILGVNQRDIPCTLAHLHSLAWLMQGMEHTTN